MLRNSHDNLNSVWLASRPTKTFYWFIDYITFFHFHGIMYIYSTLTKDPGLRETAAFISALMMELSIRTLSTKFI